MIVLVKNVLKIEFGSFAPWIGMFVEVSEHLKFSFERFS